MRKIMRAHNRIIQRSLRKGIRPVKKLEWWDAGMVICLERGADLHMAQLIPLPLTVSCFCKIQIGVTFLVPAHLGSPRQRAVKRACEVSGCSVIGMMHCCVGGPASCCLLTDAFAM